MVGGRPQHSRHCVTWDPVLFKKGHSPPIFCPCLLRPNGWMHQDTTWYGGRPQPIRHLGTQLPLKGAQPPVFAPYLLWMKMPLGKEVDLGPGHVVRREPSPTPRKGHSSPTLFGPCLLWRRSPISATTELFLVLISTDQFVSVSTAYTVMVDVPLYHITFLEGLASDVLITACTEVDN